MRPTLTEGEILRLALAAALLGIGIGIFYDLFRVIRIFRKKGKMGRIMALADHILCFFEDIIFFLVLTVANALMLSAYGAGTTRLEAPIIELIFFLLWHFTVGKLTVKCAYKAKALALRLIGYIILPIKKINSRTRKRRLDKRLRKYSHREKERLKRDFRKV